MLGLWLLIVYIVGFFVSSFIWYYVESRNDDSLPSFEDLLFYLNLDFILIASLAWPIVLLFAVLVVSVISFIFIINKLIVRSRFRKLQF